MILSTPCRVCKTEIIVDSKAPSRPELEKEVGEKFDIECPKCLYRNTVRLNKVKAHESNKTMIFGLLLTTVLTAILWIFFGAISTLSFSLVFIIIGVERQNVANFNAYKLPEY